MVLLLSITENVLFSFENSVYSPVVKRSILYMSVESVTLGIQCCSAPLFIFCLILLSSVENRILKSPITIVELSDSPLNFVSFYLIYFQPLLLREDVVIVMS